MFDRTVTPVNGRPEPLQAQGNRHEIQGGVPFSQALRTVMASRWSGQLKIASEERDDAGTAVFWQGRLGWATSQAQSETLGSFLRRLGHVTDDDLDIVQAQFDEHNGEIKLGRVLEETGIMPRRALRRCLQMHLRLAIATLLGPDCTVSKAEEGPVCSDEDVLYDIVEVLPEWADQPANGGTCILPTGPTDTVTTVLEMLKNIPGHLRSLVADRCGSVIAERGQMPANVPGSSTLANTAITLLESAMHSATWTQLGVLDFASAEGSNGAFLAHWLDPDKQYLAAVLLAPTGKVGIARYELAAAANTFRKKTGSQIRTGDDEWHK